jgi:putative oxidoreductase
MFWNHPSFLLRWALAIILLMHSIPSIMTSGVREFGLQYLNSIGFAPFGLWIAWCIKLSHVAAAICFITNKYIKPACWITIFVMVMGIIMIHAKEGWFVVGGGRNGMEFNFLLIMVLSSLLYPDGLFAKKNPS